MSTPAPTPNPSLIRTPSTPSPLVIALPQGLNLGGVSTWALRLANGFASLRRPVALLLHPLQQGDLPAASTLDPRVCRLALPDALPPLAEALGDLTPFVAEVRRALDRFEEASGPFDAPIVLSPNILGDDYAIAAELTRTEPGRVRLLAWHHADHAYDNQILARYAPVISRVVAIDDDDRDRLAERLQPALDGTSIDVVPHGVDSPTRPPTREPLFDETNRQRRALRLVYTGRLEHAQKRIGALPHLVRGLAASAIDAELRIVGDGPARDDLATTIADLGVNDRIMLCGAVALDDVTAHLDWADVFALTSRYEGLCISRIEAMARGCVPCISVGTSGTAAGIVDGTSGWLVDVSPDADEAMTGAALAGRIRTALAEGQGALTRTHEATHGAARAVFGLDAHLRAVAGVVDRCAGAPARRWPDDVPAAFSGAPDSGASGTVPPDAPQRLAALLERLDGRRIVIHGSGQHTTQLASVFDEASAEVVAIADDDPQRWGDSILGRDIIDPRCARSTGATEVVISSWLHADAIWARRDVYEAQGLSVHHLYQSAP